MLIQDKKSFQHKLIKFIYAFNDRPTTSIQFNSIYVGTYSNNKNLEAYQYNQHEHLIN